MENKWNASQLGLLGEKKIHSVETDIVHHISVWLTAPQRAERMMGVPGLCRLWAEIAFDLHCWDRTQCCLCMRSLLCISDDNCEPVWDSLQKLSCFYFLKHRLKYFNSTGLSSQVWDYLYSHLYCSK